MKSMKTCSGTADYSKVTGDRILPFRFVLNEADSVLNPVEVEMQVCITFTQTYPVGPVNVCVFGGNTVATGLTICGPVCG